MSEIDPTGRDAHESGSKLDDGKNRLGLVIGDFARSLKAVGEVGTYGAIKYTDGGWVEVPNGIKRYTDATMRHFLDEMSGVEYDKDTELLHAAHFAWNALARLDLIIREKENKKPLDKTIKV